MRLRQRLVLVGLGAVAVSGLALAVLSDDGDDGSRVGGTTSTTLRTGGIDVDAPAGYLAVPLPSFGLGIAVPDEWQVTRTDADTLATLEGRPLVNAGFLAAARNAGAAGAVVYGAGVDDDGRVSDVKVLIYRVTEPLDARSLERFARDLVARTPLRDAEVSTAVVDGDPTATIRFRTSGGGVEALGTQHLRADGDRIVSVVVTSEDAAAHDELAAAIIGSLVLG